METQIKFGFRHFPCVPVGIQNCDIHEAVVVSEIEGGFFVIKFYVTDICCVKGARVVNIRDKIEAWL